MGRKPRSNEPDSFHHVTARGTNGGLLFREPEDRRELLHDLGVVVHRNEWRCHAYCLIGTHFHLLVHTPKPTLSIGIGRLCSSYAQWFNWKYGRTGHVFAHRFSSRTITEETHLFAAHRYIALNPVEAGLCGRPAGWPWGSYRALAGFARPRPFLDVDAVYSLFSPRRDEAQLAYRAFVESELNGWGQAPSGPDPFAESKSRKLSATRFTASS